MKNKELFNLSYKIYEEDQKRFNNIDDKAFKFFTIFTIIIGLLGFFGKYLIDNISISTNTFVFYLLGIIYFLLFPMIVFSWVSLFNVINLRDRKKVPFNDKMIDFWQYTADIEEIYLKLSRLVEEAINKNKAITDNKAKKLNYALECINITILLLGCFFVFMAINELYRKIQ